MKSQISALFLTLGMGGNVVFWRKCKKTSGLCNFILDLNFKHVIFRRSHKDGLAVG